MKIRKFIARMTVIAGVAFIMTCLFTPTAFSQEKIYKGGAGGSVKIRIEKDENGKHTIIDTVFNLNDKKGKEGYEIFMKESDTPGHGNHKGMKNIEMEVSSLAKADSMDVDSLENLEKDVRVFTSDGKHFHIEGIGDDDSFDFPGPPEPPFPPSCDGMEMPFPPGMDEGSGNLLDVLRSIPMNRVRNFSIKENKHGTRIIIDVDRAPVLEMPPRHMHHVYINNDGERMMKSGNHGKQRTERKIIIMKGEEEKRK